MIVTSRALGGLLSLAILSACVGTVTVPSSELTSGAGEAHGASLEWLHCPRLTSFKSEGDLEAALPELSRSVGGRDLLVIGTTVFVCPCSDTQQLGGDSMESQFESKASGRDLDGSTSSVASTGSSTSTRASGSSSSTSAGGGVGLTRTGGESTGSDLTGDEAVAIVSGEESGVRSAGEGSSLDAGGDVSTTEGGAESASTSLAGEHSLTNSAGSASSTLLSSKESSTEVGALGTSIELGGATMVPRCAKVRRALSYIVENPSSLPVHVFDGLQLYALEGERLVPVRRGS